jgi:hypothetical protein
LEVKKARQFIFQLAKLRFAVAVAAPISPDGKY